MFLLENIEADLSLVLSAPLLYEKRIQGASRILKQNYFVVYRNYSCM